MAQHNPLLMWGITLLMMKLLKSFDLIKPEYAKYYLSLYFTVYSTIYLVCYFVRQKIKAKNDQATVNVPPPVQIFEDATNSPPAPEKKSAMDYDLNAINNLIRSVDGLISQCGPTIYSFIHNPVIQIHLLNKSPTGDLKRPFASAKNIMSVLLDKLNNADNEEVDTKKEEKKKQKKLAVLDKKED